MDSKNRNDYIPPGGFDPAPPVNPFAERGRHSFGRRTDLAREKFLPESVWREIDLGEQQRETDNGAGPTRPKREETSQRLTDPYPVSAADIRVHARLVERLMLLHYERYGLWPRLRRFLFGNRLIRWLVLHTLGEKDHLRKTQSDIRGVLGERSMDAASFRETRFRPYQGRECPSSRKG
jgi:hypothetical protein